mmetsp:Transcript_22565/g.52545  ORF Transcript_22565/g.52545 Transcript_22565/m.52545 type:complete len:215 (+) Transcript_22565:1201-1845(+)
MARLRCLHHQGHRHQDLHLPHRTVQPHLHQRMVQRQLHHLLRRRLSLTAAGVETRVPLHASAKAGLDAAPAPEAPVRAHAARALAREGEAGPGGEVLRDGESAAHPDATGDGADPDSFRDGRHLKEEGDLELGILQRVAERTEAPSRCAVTSREATALEAIAADSPMEMQVVEEAQRRERTEAKAKAKATEEAKVKAKEAVIVGQAIGLAQAAA